MQLQENNTIRTKATCENTPKKTYPGPPRILRSLKHPEFLFLRIGLRPSTHRSLPVQIHQEVVQIAPPAFASQVCIVSGRDQAHGFGRARIQIAGIVRALLDLVSLQLALIVDDRVVRCFHSALETGVCLEIKVEIISAGETVSGGQCNRRRGITDIAVIPLSTTVPGRVFPFLSA